MKFDVDKYKLLFISETREHLEEISKILNSTKENFTEEEINTLFREAHSIKGMSSAMGYNDLSELSHSIENVLGMVRSGKVLVNRDLVEILIEATDTLWKAIEAIERNESYGDLKSLIERINSLELKKEDEKILGTKINVEITLKEGIPSPTARAFLIYKNLESFGTIIKSEPPIENIKKGEFEGNLKIRIELKKPFDVIEKYFSTVSEIKSFSIKPINEKESTNDKESNKDEKPSLPQYLKVQISDLDYFLNITGELLTIKSQIKENIKDIDNIEVSNSLNQMEILLKDLQNKVMKMRMVPLDIIFSNIPRWVRDLCHRLNKKVETRIDGGNIELDRSVIEALTDPLLHIIRNAVDHGIETEQERLSSGKPTIGLITINAKKDKDRVIINIQDDGRGIDIDKVKESAIKSKKFSEDYVNSITDRKKIFYLLTVPGLSTKEEITDISGRGVGLDVVKTVVEGFGGNLDIDSEFGKGTKIDLIIPATISIINVLFFRVGKYILGCPVDKVIAVLKINDSIKKIVDDKNVISYKDEYLPLQSLSDKFYSNKEVNLDGDFVIVTEVYGKKIAILVDELLGQKEVYLRPLNKPLSLIPGFYSSTILGDGVPVLVIDFQGILA